MILLLITVVVLAGCRLSTGLPELPQLRLEAFAPPVRAAIARAQRDVVAHPYDAALWGRLGMVLHAHEQFAAAIQAYTRAEVLDQRNAVWPYYRADALSQLGDWQGAREALQHSLRLDGSYTPARLRMAALLLETGNLSAAELAYRPHDSSDALYGLGRTLAALGRRDEAIDALQRACTLTPAYGAAHLALARLLQQAGRVQLARRHFDLAQAYHGQTPGIPDPRMAGMRALDSSATGLIRRGARLEAEGRIQEAISAHLQAVEADPNSEQAHTNLISLFARTGDSGKVNEHYHSALAINPGFADAHYNFGVFLFSQGQFERAGSAFRQAAQSNPHHARAWLNLGFIEERNGNSARALTLYQKAAELLPSLRLAHFHAGRILTNERRYQEAIARFSLILTPEDQETPGYYYAMGIAYGRSGDLPTAREWLTRALAMAEEQRQHPLTASIRQDIARLGTPP